MAAHDDGIIFDFSDFESKMLEIAQKVESGLLMLAQTEATKLRAYMQVNRPWTDRTGEAKRRLDAVVSRPTEHEIRITLLHGVNYGIWLELAHNKKYAIIQPTINVKSNEVLSNFQNLVKKILS